MTKHPNVSASVIETIAEATASDPIDLPPLYDFVDPDALNALFGSGANCTLTHVEFHYGNYDVSITYNGELEISVHSL